MAAGWHCERRSRRAPTRRKSRSASRSMGRTTVQRRITSNRPSGTVPGTETPRHCELAGDRLSASDRPAWTVHRSSSSRRWRFCAGRAKLHSRHCREPVKTRFQGSRRAAAAVTPCVDDVARTRQVVDLFGDPLFGVVGAPTPSADASARRSFRVGGTSIRMRRPSRHRHPASCGGRNCRSGRWPTCR
jgi:hypothetical protein